MDVQEKNIVMETFVDLDMGRPTLPPEGISDCSVLRSAV